MYLVKYRCFCRINCRNYCISAVFFVCFSVFCGFFFADLQMNASKCQRCAVTSPASGTAHVVVLFFAPPPSLSVFLSSDWPRFGGSPLIQKIAKPDKPRFCEMWAIFLCGRWSCFGLLLLQFLVCFFVDHKFLATHRQCMNTNLDLNECVLFTIIYKYSAFDHMARGY